MKKPNTQSIKALKGIAKKFKSGNAQEQLASKIIGNLSTSDYTDIINNVQKKNIPQSVVDARENIAETKIDNTQFIKTFDVLLYRAKIDLSSWKLFLREHTNTFIACKLLTDTPLKITLSNFQFFNTNINQSSNLKNISAIVVSEFDDAVIEIPNIFDISGNDVPTMPQYLYILHFFGHNVGIANFNDNAFVIQSGELLNVNNVEKDKRLSIKFSSWLAVKFDKNLNALLLDDGDIIFRELKYDKLKIKVKSHTLLNYGGCSLEFDKFPTNALVIKERPPYTPPKPLPIYKTLFDVTYDEAANDYQMLNNKVVYNPVIKKNFYLSGPFWGQYFGVALHKSSSVQYQVGTKNLIHEGYMYDTAIDAGLPYFIKMDDINLSMFILFDEDVPDFVSLEIARVNFGITCDFWVKDVFFYANLRGGKGLDHMTSEDNPFLFFRGTFDGRFVVDSDGIFFGFYHTVSTVRFQNPLAPNKHSRGNLHVTWHYEGNKKSPDNHVFGLGAWNPQSGNIDGDVYRVNNVCSYEFTNTFGTYFLTPISETTKGTGTDGRRRLYIPINNFVARAKNNSNFWTFRSRTEADNNGSFDNTSLIQDGFDFGGVSSSNAHRDQGHGMIKNTWIKKIEMLSNPSVDVTFIQTDGTRITLTGTLSAPTPNQNANKQKKVKQKVDEDNGNKLAIIPLVPLYKSEKTQTSLNPEVYCYSPYFDNTINDWFDLLDFIIHGANNTIAYTFLSSYEFFNKSSPITEKYYTQFFFWAWYYTYVANNGFTFSCLLEEPDVLWWTLNNNKLITDASNSDGNSPPNPKLENFPYAVQSKPRAPVVFLIEAFRTLTSNSKTPDVATTLMFNAFIADNYRTITSGTTTKNDHPINLTLYNGFNEEISWNKLPNNGNVNYNGIYSIFNFSMSKYHLQPTYQGGVYNDVHEFKTPSDNLANTYNVRAVATTTDANERTTPAWGISYSSTSPLSITTSNPDANQDFPDIVRTTPLSVFNFNNERFLNPIDANQGTWGGTQFGIGSQYYHFEVAPHDHYIYQTNWAYDTLNHNAELKGVLVFKEEPKVDNVSTEDFYFVRNISNDSLYNHNKNNVIKILHVPNPLPDMTKYYLQNKFDLGIINNLFIFPEDNIKDWPTNKFVDKISLNKHFKNMDNNYDLDIKTPPSFYPNVDVNVAKKFKRLTIRGVYGSKASIQFFRTNANKEDELTLSLDSYTKGGFDLFDTEDDTNTITEFIVINDDVT